MFQRNRLYKNLNISTDQLQDTQSLQPVSYRLPDNLSKNFRNMPQSPNKAQEISRKFVQKIRKFVQIFQKRQHVFKQTSACPSNHLPIFSTFYIQNLFHKSGKNITLQQNSKINTYETNCIFLCLSGFCRHLRFLQRE